MVLSLFVLISVWVGLSGCSAPTGSENNPVLLVFPVQLEFGEDSNAKEVVISNTGSGVLHWSIGASEEWISVDPSSGDIVNQPVRVKISINRDRAPVGQREVKLTVVSDGGQQEVVLRATIRRPGKLSLSVAELDFGLVDTDKQVELRNEGGESLNWTGTPRQEWITINPAADTIQAGSGQIITVTIDRTKLPPSTISPLGSVDFGSLSLSIKAQVPESPTLAVGSDTLDFSEDKNSLALTINNSGTGELHWEIRAPSEGWISLSRLEGNTTTQAATIDVRIDREKAPAGQQEVKLVVTSDGGQQEVVLRATIRRPASVCLINAQLDFGLSILTQQVTLQNCGGESLEWRVTTGQDWITIAPTSGSLSPDQQQSVTVTIDRSRQPAGTIQGSVDFTSDKGGSVSAKVMAEVPPKPFLVVSPAELDFGISQTRLPLDIRNSGGGILEWILGTTDNWIKPTTSNGELASGESGRVFIDITREGLEVGTYTGHLTLHWGTETADVRIIVQVAARPILSVSDVVLDLETDSIAVFNIINKGTGSLNWQITKKAEWLELNRNTGTTTTLLPEPVQIKIKREGLRARSYADTLVINSDGVDGGDQKLVVRMRVGLPEVQLIGGPTEGEEVDTDLIDFRFVALDAYGKVEFRARLNEGAWSDWTTNTEMSFSDLEESSLAGEYTFQVQVRSDAGQSVVVERKFSVNSIKGPALRFSPKSLKVQVGENSFVDLVAEEVGRILGAHVVVVFDPNLISIQRIEIAEESPSFVGNLLGGTVIQPDPIIDNTAGLIDLSVAVVGSDQTASIITGSIVRLHFMALRAGSGIISIRPNSVLRDLDNQDIPVKANQVEIVVE